MFESEAPVPLAKAIHALRLELRDAMDTGEGSKLRFELAPIELTLQTATTREADGAINWWILNAGAKAAGQTGQTIKLTLDPRLITPAGLPSENRTLLEGEDI